MEIEETRDVHASLNADADASNIYIVNTVRNLISHFLIYSRKSMQK
jgi:hypothetical protein